MSGSETTDKSAQRPDESDSTTAPTEADEETCPNGESWCEGSENDDLPRFACFSMGGRTLMNAITDAGSSVGIEETLWL